MKKLLALYMFIGICSSVHSQPVAMHGRLRVEGTQLKDENGKPVVLRGMSFGWHNFWPRFYNKETVEWLYKDWNCSVVRAAMGVEPKKGYIEEPEWSKEKIKEVVDGAIKEGIYVIIDWHCHNIRIKEAKAFFSDIARTYRNYPNIIYEIFNEPDDESWADVKAYSADLITTIRAIDPFNIILVGSPHWDQDIHMAAEDPLQGFTNIMYTAHFYAATHKQWLRDRCEYALRKGLPLFISESAGMEASGDGPINDNEWKIWIEWAEKNKISWVTWSVSDKNESCSVLMPSASSTGNWQQKDLKESGLKTKSFIKEYALKDSELH